MPNKRRPSPEYKWAKSFGRKTTLHRAIMERHLGYALPSSVHVHHINGDKKDNRLENLQVIAAVDHGLLHAPPQYPTTKVCPVCGVTYRPHKTKRKRSVSCGAVCGQVMAGLKRRKLDANQRQQVRELYASGLTQTELAANFGVSQSTIWAIVSG
jgi:hypothetical protein